MKKIFFVSLLATSLNCHSAGSQTGIIKYIQVRASDGLVYFALKGTKVNSPPCATNHYWMIQDENSEAGKKQFSMLLAAATSGITISVEGTNDCSRWGDGESVNKITFRL